MTENILTHRTEFECKLVDPQDYELMKELLIGTIDEEAQNPFTKESVMLCPEAIAIYDFIIGCQVVNDGWSEQKTNKFYTALDIFRNNWPEEYMKLLD